MLPAAKIFLLAMLLLLAYWIATPKFGHGSDARHRAAAVQIAAFHTGLDHFVADLGRMPTLAEQLDCLLTAPAGATNWNGPYFREIPLDPWGRRYLYRPQPERGTNAYQILSAGPDGRFGTADDITVPAGWKMGMAVKP